VAETAVDIAVSVIKKAVGFLEEAPGVKSSTRLIAVSCIACAASLTVVLDWYIVYCTTRTPMHIPSSDLINSCVLLVTAFVANGAVAIVRRTQVNSGDPS
jgi:hypothetical protein